MTASEAMDAELERELHGFQQKGRLRSLRRIDAIEDNRVLVDGKLLHSFGSNDYLGLARNQRVIDAARAAQSWGAGATGSRLATGNFQIHEMLERTIAAFKHTEAALVFSSGYAANIGTISALARSGDLILSDELNHASIIDGCRLSKATVRVYRHCDVAHAAELLRDRKGFQRVLVVTDGVFSMDGDLAPLPALVELCKAHRGWLMVDDAHGTGVFGETGSGTVEHFGLTGLVEIQMGTLSKALGSLGGFVAGSTTLVNYLVNSARSFIFSTALPAADIAAATTALEIINNEPQLRAKLAINIGTIRDGLRELRVEVLPGTSPIIPLVVGSATVAVALSKQLEMQGYWIPAIREPTVPVGKSRLRLTVSAKHEPDMIGGLLAALKQVIRDNA